MEVASKRRGSIWPLILLALGVINLTCHFMGFSPKLDFLLKGVGFLMMVPQTYLSPRSSGFGAQEGQVALAPWAKWLSVAGFALVIVGFVVGWMR